MPICCPFGLLQSECVEYGHSPSFLHATVHRQTSPEAFEPQQRHVRPPPLQEAPVALQEPPASEREASASPVAPPSAAPPPLVPLVPLVPLEPPLVEPIAPFAPASLPEPASIGRSTGSSLEPPQWIAKLASDRRRTARARSLMAPMVPEMERATGGRGCTSTPVAPCFHRGAHLRDGGTRPTTSAA